MFKRVMVATDLSLTSDELVAGLAGLANWGTEEVALAYASDFATQGSPSCEADSRNAVIEDRVRRELGRLAGQKRILEQAAFSVSTHHVIGRPDGVLTKLAESWGADLLLLGLRRISLARNIALGSTAFEILRYSPVPVLLVRPEMGVSAGSGSTDGEGMTRMGRILFATDFSPAANEAYRMLSDIARSRHVAVTVFHTAAGGAEVAPAVNAHMEKLASGLRDAGAEVRVMLGDCDPALEIPIVCERTAASLLVMGTNGKGVIGEFFVGSVSQAVARRVAIPVLLVREAGRVPPERTGHLRKESPVSPAYGPARPPAGMKCRLSNRLVPYFLEGNPGKPGLPSA